MTGSQEGHRRFRTRKELGRLVGTHLDVCYSDEKIYSGGILERITNKEKNNENGFYINGHKIFIRSIKKISEEMLTLNQYYINKTYRGEQWP